MKVYKVKWRDSHRYMYQMEKSETVNIIIIETIGFFVKEDKKQIVLAQDIIGEDIRGVICIPKENIVSKKVIHNLTCKQKHTMLVYMK